MCTHTHNSAVCMLVTPVDDRREKKRDSVQVWKTSLPHCPTFGCVLAWSRRYGGIVVTTRLGRPSSERARASSKAGSALVMWSGDGDPLSGGGWARGPTTGSFEAKAKILETSARFLSKKKIRRGTGAFSARARHWECWEPVASMLADKVRWGRSLPAAAKRGS